MLAWSRHGILLPDCGAPFWPHAAPLAYAETLLVGGTEDAGRRSTEWVRIGLVWFGGWLSRARHSGLHRHLVWTMYDSMPRRVPPCEHTSVHAALLSVTGFRRDVRRGGGSRLAVPDARMTSQALSRC